MLTSAERRTVLHLWHIAETYTAMYSTTSVVQCWHLQSNVMHYICGTVLTPTEWCTVHLWYSADTEWCTVHLRYSADTYRVVYCTTYVVKSWHLQSDLLYICSTVLTSTVRRTVPQLWYSADNYRVMYCTTSVLQCWHLQSDVLNMSGTVLTHIELCTVQHLWYSADTYKVM